MIGAAFGAGRPSDGSVSQRSYDTFDHGNDHPIRYTKPYMWMSHKSLIERASGVFATGFMNANGVHYAGYPRLRAGPAVEWADTPMASSAAIKRSNGRLWQSAWADQDVSATISALFDFEQRTETPTSMGAMPANGTRAWRGVSVIGVSSPSNAPGAVGHSVWRDILTGLEASKLT